jgi:putative oxidoreductase
MSTSSLNVQPAVAAAIARGLLAALFLISGIQKLFVPDMIQGYIASVGLPFPSLVYAITVVIEIGAGTLLLVGFRTRLMAGVLAAFTVAAALLFHRALGDPNQFVHFLKNLAIAGGLLHVSAVGAGAFSVDGHTLAGRRAAA